MQRRSRVGQIEPSDSKGSYQRDSGSTKSTAGGGIMDTDIGVI